MPDRAALLGAGDPAVVSDDDLRTFITARRWFGAKSREVVQTRLVDLTPLPGDVPLAIGLVEVRYQPGTHDMYQLVLGVRPAGGDPASRVASDRPLEVFEALDGVVGWQPLLTLVRQGVTVHAAGSHIRFAEAETGVPDTAAEPQLLGSDQSNSAAAFGEDLFMKAYRHLEPGVNPELEMLRFLSEHEFDNSPELVGWYERSGEPLEATLGVVLRYIPQTQDGFTLVLDALASDPTTVFPLLRRLGEVTGEMHAVLASESTDPLFAPEIAGAQSMDLIRASIDEDVTDLFSGLGDHPDLGDLAGRLEEVRDRLRGMEPVGELGRRIRQHGDFHLGQALWNGEDWVIIDFEGEPARPVAERRQKRLPLRDVAGMMRSISYAMWVARLDGGHLVPPEWENDARAAFLDGYQAVVEPLGLLPALRESTQALLDMFELEKAVYELRYELDHRPAWARIPAAGIVALLERVAA